MLPCLRQTGATVASVGAEALIAVLRHNGPALPLRHGTTVLPLGADGAVPVFGRLRLVGDGDDHRSPSASRPARMPTSRPTHRASPSGFRRARSANQAS